MKVIEYAYEYSYTWADNYRTGGWDIVHGKTRGEAKMNAYRNSESDRFEDLFDMRLRRRPELDRCENIPHELLSTLTEEQKSNMLHTIGNDMSTEPYRNRYVVEHDESFEDLISKGLAGKARRLDMNVYYLTELGIKVIQSTMPIARFALTSHTLKTTS